MSKSRLSTDLDALQSGELYLPPLYPKQHAAMYAPTRYSLIEASTKAGKTTGCIVWILDNAWQSQEHEIWWWVAPVRAQAKIAYKRIKTGLTFTVGVEFRDGDLEIRFPGSGVIQFKSAEDPDTLYGEHVSGAVMDEASRTRQESWFAFRSTLSTTRGPMRLIGNVKGRKNWFFKLCRKAESGEKNMTYTKLTAFDAVEGGIMDAEEIEDARRVLPEHVWEELYLAEASEDGANPFGMAAIAQCIAPLSELPPVAFGVDLAKSVDWTVSIGIDQFGHVCRFDRFQSPWSSTVTRVSATTGSVPSLVDSTGVGDPIVEQMQSDAGSSVSGFKFTSPSKQQLVEGLIVAVQSGEIMFPDGPIRAELEAFEYVYTKNGVRYAAPDGMHDDCVMALALAWKQYKERPIARFAVAGKRQMAGRRA